ncbi:hypothetical protein TSMEX_003366 [Taenia solium]|eukprot:TsM_001181900 transcript=TsM_001181900 gene=TsM_001181900
MEDDESKVGDDVPVILSDALYLKVGKTMMRLILQGDAQRINDCFVDYLLPVFTAGPFTET